MRWGHSQFNPTSDKGGGEGAIKKTQVEVGEELGTLVPSRG